MLANSPTLAQTQTLQMHSQKLGVIHYKPAEIIHFNKGLLGFPYAQRFLLIACKEIPFFVYLQCLDNDITLILTHAKLFLKAYNLIPYLGENVPEENPKKSEIDFNTVTITNDETANISLNLMGPILIDIRNKTGRQIIIEGDNYTTKHFVTPNKLTKLLEEKHSVVHNIRKRMQKTKHQSHNKNYT